MIVKFVIMDTGSGKIMAMDKPLEFAMAGMLLLLVIMVGVILFDAQQQGKDYSADLNILKNNDLAFAQYITANSQAYTQLQELSKNCKTIEDTNFATTIQCAINK